MASAVQGKVGVDDSKVTVLRARRFQVSWYEPMVGGTLETPQYADIKLPFPWWVTGGTDTGAAIISAAILAYSPEDALEWVRRAREQATMPAYRYVTAMSSDWSPFDDAHKRADWMTWP